MKVLITGANGLIGQHIGILLLKSNDIKLLPTGIGESRVKDFEKIYQKLDISNTSKLKSFLKFENPDIVINCAAISHVDTCEEFPDKCLNVNVNGVKNLVDSLKSNSKLIHLSSDFVFDGTSLNYKENDKTNPLSVYGKSKLQAEEYIQQNFINHQIIRTVLVFGFGENLSRNNILTWVYSSLSQNKKIKVVNDQVRKPTYVKDLAKAIFELMVIKQNSTFHISGEEEISIFQLAKKVADVYSFDKNLISSISSKSLNELGKRPPITGFNLDKISSIINYKPQSITNALIDSKNGLIHI
jgi:dTDP-4-dehydrorhamnose reductase